MSKAINIFVFGFIILCVFIYFDSKGPANADIDQYLEDKELTISMDLQDASIKDVLKVFSIQSGMNFIADETLKDRKVTLYFDKVPIKDALNNLLKANNLTVEFDEVSNIFIVKYWGEPAMQTITRVYTLKYRSVGSSNIDREKETILKEIGMPVGEADKSLVTTPSSKETDILGAVQQVLSKSGKANEDKKTNSLIVTDVPSRFPMIEQVIAALDVPQPQVMLEVEMLDVSKDTMDNMGFDIGDVTTAANPLTLIFPGNISGASAFLGTRSTVGADGAVTMGSTYSALLNFLSQQSDTKYLARPRIMTMNNETAEIAITKDEVVQVNTTVEEIGDQPYVSEEYIRASDLKLTPEGIGVFLRVTPLVNIDTGEITMVLNPKTSSTVDSPGLTEFARDPEIRSTKSVIKIKDGETVVLGGLIHKERSDSRTKVPILGDIPVMGALFRKRFTDKNIERELLVFITPHIIKDESLKLAQRNRTRLPPLDQNSSAKTDRYGTVDNFLNIFDRKKY